MIVGMKAEELGIDKEGKKGKVISDTEKDSTLGTSSVFS